MSGLHRLIIALALAGLLAIGAIVGFNEPASAPPSSNSQGEQEEAAQEEEGEEAEEYAPGEVLVKFKDRASRTTKQEVHAKKRTRAKETLPGIDVEVVAVNRGQEKAKAKEYQDDPNVEFAEVNGLYEAVQTLNSPNDSRVSEQWQYQNSRYVPPKKAT
jgi:hypothetical protein